MMELRGIKRPRPWRVVAALQQLRELGILSETSHGLTRQAATDDRKNAAFERERRAGSHPLIG
jgi:hypothetical protein